MITVRILALFALSCALVSCVELVARPDASNGGHGSFTMTHPDPAPPAATAAIDQILAAARRGDQAALLSRISDNAVFSFGTDMGHADFLRLWRDPGPNPFARFAQAFAQTTAPGGVDAGDGQWRYPYHTWILANGVDPQFVVQVAGGTVHRAPRPDAPTIALAPTDSVHCADPACFDGDTDAWRQLRLRDGTAAYARETALRPVTDGYRLVLEETADGAYEIEVFLTGD